MAYIEREAALAATCQYCSAKEDCLPNERCVDYELVNSIPTADVAPVRHGRWLSKEYMYGDPDAGISDMWIDRPAEPSDYYAYCSACGEDAGYNEEGTLILSNYCPNCGAKMDGGNDG